MFAAFRVAAGIRNSGRMAMERWIPEIAGSFYCWEPDLGGFRKAARNSPNVALRHPSFRAYADYMESAAFAGALADLLEKAAAMHVAIMCSETVWWRCHRRLISDAALLLHGKAVYHLMHDGKLRPHLPTAGVRTTNEGTLATTWSFKMTPLPDDALEHLRFA